MSTKDVPTASLVMERNLQFLNMWVGGSWSGDRGSILRYVVGRDP
jgi:hypothetical protein